MAIHGFEAGQLVVCTYRMPSVLQPWIHPIYVGVVQEPGDDPAAWNGANTERAYCVCTATVPVRYEGRWLQHDAANSLILVTPEEAAFSHAGKVRRFLGVQAAAALQAASTRRSRLRTCAEQGGQP
jgi:hypothetical protein